MNLPFEIPDVDWSNSDVRKVVEMIGNRYDQKCKENEDQQKMIEDLKKRMLQSGQAASGTQTGASCGAGRPRNKRSYNAWEFKDYPRPKNTPKLGSHEPYRTEYT